jgi:murein DD-endopeptidase MepM/ murein hydrolase activator NlpD
MDFHLRLKPMFLWPTAFIFGLVTTQSGPGKIDATEWSQDHFENGSERRPTAQVVPKENKVMSLGWGGLIDTDLKFSEFFGRDHSLVIRFLPQYVHAYAGPLFAENGAGTYIVGVGEYRWGQGGHLKAGAPVLFMEIGGKRKVYDLSDLEKKPPVARDAEVFADFERGTYEGWTIEGDCFGERPANDKFNGQWPVRGWRGKFFVNTFQADDGRTGKATSRPFHITKRYIHFLIGGGRHPGRCCLNLLIDDKVVASATGRDSEELAAERWDVEKWKGRNATLEIVDVEKGGWGHVLVDQIVFSNSGNPALIFPGVLKETWQHLAVVRRGNTFSLYLNGIHLVPDLDGPGPDLPLAATLRLGRRTAGKRIDGTGNGQFFGLIDDVGVFRRALTEAEIQELSEQQRLTGSEKNLYAGWTFDTSGVKEPPLPMPLRRRIDAHKTRAHAESASSERDHVADAQLFNLNETKAKLQLPFAINEAWQVIQGVDEAGGSHNSYAAFCWDFILAGRPQSESKGQPLYAATDGRLIYVEETHPLGGKEGNVVLVKQAEGEYWGFLHIFPGSYSATLPKPQPRPTKKDQPMVRAGQRLAAVGDTGANPGAFHLHFGLGNAADTPQNHQPFVTIPASFTDYEASDDQGKTWHKVKRGVPQNGQWVRRKGKE